MLVLSCMLIGLLSWLQAICYDNLKYWGRYCYTGRTYPHQSFYMVFLELCGVSISPSSTFAEIWDMLNDFLYGFHNIIQGDISNVGIYASPVYGFTCYYSHLLNSYIIIMPLTPCLFCSSLGVTIHLPFSIIPSINAILYLNVQYHLISCSTSFLLSGQPPYDVLL